MRALLRLALRNTLRNTRRNGFIVLALALCAAGFVLLSNIIHGFYGAIIDHVIAAQAGDVVVRSPAWVADPDPRHALTGTAALADRLRRVPGVADVVPRLEVPALLNTTEGSSGVLAVGVDPAAEHRVSGMVTQLREGRYLEPGDDHAAVIGASLASHLGLHVGARMVLMAADSHGEIASQMVRLVGVLQVGGELGAGLVHAPLPLVRRLVGAAPDAVTQLAAIRGRGVSRDRLLAQVRAALPQGVRVRPWARELPQLATFMYGDLSTFAFIVVVLVIVVSLGMWNVLLMRVLARRKEFGLLAAIGMAPRRIIGMVMLETGLLSTIGVALGLALGAALSALLASHGLRLAPEGFEMAGLAISPVARPEWYSLAVAASLGALLGLTVLAALAPAVRAARTDPRRALEES